MSQSISSSPTIRVEYNDTIVRYFLLATMIWGLIGMTVGVLIAGQLAFWQLNFGEQSWLTFGRLRPLHTNAVIFAFVGNMMFAGIYHSTQRLCKARLASDKLSWIHFWGWQTIIVSAVITLPLGLSRSKEYAELIWPIDLLVVFTWVIFAINFFWTLAIRRERSLYVAIWFYIATIVTVAVLYIVNNLQIPTSLLHAYPIFGGVQDALIQWWYGHNAVAFFLTTPILGIMYYYLPKAANRPVYSYRLSIVHFWSLVFIYIWAGPHHLLYTGLPVWLQSLGMLFSLMLWAPSWGGMLNGLLTLRGAWHKLRTDPVLKFLVAGVTFYGMATFEGPMLSIKTINALSHYTDWTIGHVHSAALGWNGLMTAGVFYWLAPRLWNTRLYSVSLANWHFWVALVGILFYTAAMWVSGITQGLMLNATTDGGNTLAYPSFIETIDAILPMYHLRMLGGMLYLVGFILMAYNLYKTIRSGEAVNGYIEVAEEQEEDRQQDLGLVGTFLNAPVMYCTLIMLSVLMWLFGGDAIGFIGLFLTIVFTLITIVHFQFSVEKWSDWYDKLQANLMPFTILTLVAVLIGGLVQIVPLVTLGKYNNPTEGRIQVPYTPLELLGRDIYVREGCYNCHSQTIRPFLGETLRYGDYSRLGEFIYDYPYQWGSKRTGPDLHRVGGKYTDAWHWRHMLDARETSAGSTMPNYPWLYRRDADFSVLPRRIQVMRILGVPYEEDLPERAEEEARQQAAEIAANLQREGFGADPDKEIIALIAYLQKLGKSVDASELNAQENE
ncbi:MAG: cytochrome-c oxidase, cbb3-type subunit I [Opitutales bacterium]|nr:cytochrome-c oxidase, cbb3-type subunit I [Opitutales bacterium]